MYVARARAPKIDLRFEDSKKSKDLKSGISMTTKNDGTMRERQLTTMVIGREDVVLLFPSLT
jgi:hypothetical protein